MALLRPISFEADTVTNGIEVTTNNFGSGTAPTIVTSPVIDGTYCMKCSTATTNSDAMYQFSSGGIGVAFIHVQFYIKSTDGYPSANCSILDLGTAAAAYGAIYMNSSGQCGINYNVGTTSTYDGTLTSAVSFDTPHYLDLKIDTTTANVQVVTGYLDGVEINSVNGSRTLAANSLTLGVWGVGLRESTASTIYFDSIVINDNSGASMNSLAGNIHDVRFTPSATGDVNTLGTQTGGTAGSANNYTRVMETTPDGATTFNGSATLNQSDLYAVSGPTIPSGATINYVALFVWYRASTASAEASFKLQAEKASAGTIAQSSAIQPNSTTFKANANAVPLNSPLILYNDPDGSPWTLSTIASMQIGMMISTGNTNRADISTIWADVGYTPSSAVNASVTQVAASVTAGGGTQAVSAIVVQNGSVTQTAASVTATGGSQAIATQLETNVSQAAASVTASGGTQAIATVDDVSVSQVAASVTASGGTQTAVGITSASVTQVAASVTASGGIQSTGVAITQSAATVTATGGSQAIASVRILALSQVAASVTATGGTQAIQGVQDVNISQVAANVTAAGGTQSVATINDVSIAQTAASVTATGGTQIVATIRDTTVAQSAATITASGGIQSATGSTVVSASVTQVAASVTASGGTPAIATVNIAAVSQSAAIVTATGGTQVTATVRDASIAQVAANVTATGGTQTVSATSQTNASVTQLAASVTATGGVQAVASVVIAAITQIAASVTATGGTQSIQTIRVVQISQVAASVTATGGAQSMVAVSSTSITQSAAVVTARGGTQSVAQTLSASVVQAAATVTASGGVPVVLFALTPLKNLTMWNNGDIKSPTTFETVPKGPGVWTPNNAKTPTMFTPGTKEPSTWTPSST